MTRMFRSLTFWLSLAGLTGLGLFMINTNATQPMPEPPSPPPEKAFEKSIAASGIVEALSEDTEIGVPVAGLVTEVSVKVWDKVQAGDVILKLDDRDLQAQRISQQSELGLREAELERAVHRHDRLAKIGASAVAAEDIAQREDDVLVARAQVERARASLEENARMLDRLTVRAPISGTILQVNIRAGEYSSPSASTAPIVLGSIDDLQIRVDVDEQLAPRVEEGARAVAYRKGETGSPITLTFVRIEPYIVPKRSLTGSSSERVDTRVLPVIFRFNNQAGLKTYVGQQVDVFIEE